MNERLKKIVDQISRYNMRFNVFQKWKIREELKCFTDYEIINQIGMAEMPKIVYLLNLKHQGKIQWIQIENDLMIRIGNTNVANMSYLAVYLHFFRIEDDCLHIEGNISLPTAAASRNTFFIRHNGEKIICEMNECGMDCRLGKNIYEKRTVFSANLPLDSKVNQIAFFNCMDGIECRYGKINAMRFFPVADCINEQYCRIDDWMISIQENILVCNKMQSNNEEMEQEKRYQNELIKLNIPDENWAVSLRRKYFEEREKKVKKIWLFMDRPDRADDNAEALFKYVQRHVEVDSYFILDKSSIDYKRIAEIGKVIELYSEQHYLLVLLADYIISSQCNGVVENPFWDKAEAFRDLYHKPKIIFLQHGVIKDDMSPTLNRFNTNFTGFITSTQAEYESVLNYPYFYSENEVWCTGLPIFDELEDRKQKIILIMPTWRQELMHQEWNLEKEAMEWIPNHDIRESEYYKKFYSLLHNKKLLTTCENDGYKIAFMPHPLLEPYIRDIADIESIELWDSGKSYKDAFAEGSLLVTDYSSVAFEFAYLRKPIIYYQFDEETFFEKHTYRKGYFDYKKDGFGYVESQEDSIVNRMCKYIKNECGITETYRKRIECAFREYKGNSCEQIYRRITMGGKLS